ncbi:hypothetical protein CFC21_037653 [Triticum aestivum]|uniref:Tonoplast intrinsic protein n=2 Tax=Triticum aestivum TaxID=4565 RepID=A0A3B6EQY7_WHEAT|nr:hypothetical protein CFC21_037653 [Triticum aestivum]
MAKFALGHHSEATDAGCVRAVLAEAVLTFLFVFSGVGSTMAAGRLAGGADTIMGLTAVALAHAMVVAVMVSAGLHVSGGHITLFRSALYVLAQLLGSSLACLLLAFLTGGAVTMPVHALAAGVGAPQGVLWEAVLTFSLLFTVYATVVDPRRSIGNLGPLLVGFVVGANVLAGGPFSGASMNPARSFGPALASANWASQWVYWVGPMIGGPLAGLVYEGLFMVRPGHQQLPSDGNDF